MLPGQSSFDDPRLVAEGLATTLFALAEVIGAGDSEFAMTAFRETRRRLLPALAESPLSEQDRKAVLGALEKAEILALRRGAGR
jgi:hypothetical protein